MSDQDQDPPRLITQMQPPSPIDPRLKEKQTENPINVDPLSGEDESAIVHDEDDKSTDKLSITDLVNMDNISAHNLYLGPELRKFGSSIINDSDAYSASLLTDEEGDDEELLSSKGTSVHSGEVDSVKDIGKAGSEIDYSALDRFGFIVLGEEDMVDSKDSEASKRLHKKQYPIHIIIHNLIVLISSKRNLKEAQRATKWIEMLKILESSEKSVLEWPEAHRKFENRLTKGLPDCLRSKLWCQFTAGKSGPSHSADSFRTLYMNVSGFERQIDLDIERTLRDHVLFKIRFSSAQVSLFKILVAYSNLDPEVGYCQGMSTVAAFMLLYFEEETAFNVFVQMMQRARLRHLYMVGFSLLFETFFIHEQLMQKFLPIIHAKLNSFGITTSIYATKWYLTLFLGFPFQLATRIWDLFLYYGFDILIVASIALLKMHEDRILRLDYENAMEFLSRLADCQIDENKLVELTMRIWDRLVPSLSAYWEEQEEMTRCDLNPSQAPLLKPTKKSSVFFKLRKAYMLIKEKEAAEAALKKKSRS